MSNIPYWWPRNPYPADIFPMTTEDYAEAIPDPKLRTAVSGCIARWQFDIASVTILENLLIALEDLTEGLITVMDSSGVNENTRSEILSMVSSLIMSEEEFTESDLDEDIEG